MGLVTMEDKQEVAYGLSMELIATTTYYPIIL